MPYYILLASPNRVVGISPQRVVVLDATSGSPVVASGEVHSRIVAAALDCSEHCLVAVTEDKKLKVWEIEPGFLKLSSQRDLSKKPSCIGLDNGTDEQQTSILVGDKFGDVHVYPLHPPVPNMPSTSQRVNGSKNANKKETSSGVLLLGHVSILTSLLLTSHPNSSRRCIITADRDEHIRISRYPQAFVIENWCLGSKSFVNAIHLLPQPFEGGRQLLVSGGGEDVIRLWDWREGKCIAAIEVGSVVRPHIQAKRSKRGRYDEEGREGDTEDVNMDDDDKAEDDSVHVLVIQKITSIKVGSSQRVIFSAIGASSLFVFELLPSFTTVAFASSSPMQGLVVPSMDLGVPILDFACMGTNIIASFDFGFSVGTKDRESVRQLKWDNLKLVLDENSENPVIKGLNADIRNYTDTSTFDYYHLLDLLPKAPTREDETPQPTSSSVGGRKGLKRAAREGLRKILSEAKPDNPGAGVKKIRIDE